MLKLLLGHWHIHRKKPLLLPPEAELFAEGHNDQNPVNRINPLYEATDSDDLNSVLSTKNDAQLSDRETAKKSDVTVAQGAETSEVQELLENPSDKVEQEEVLKENAEPTSTTGGESSGLFSVNVGKKNEDGDNQEKELEGNKTNGLKESLPSENQSEKFKEKENSKITVQDKVKVQDKPSSSGDSQNLVSPEIHAQDTQGTVDSEDIEEVYKELENLSQIAGAEGENLDKASSPNEKIIKTSKNKAIANAASRSNVENDGCGSGSKAVNIPDSNKKASNQSKTSEPILRKDFEEKNSGNVTNGKSKKVKKQERTKQQPTEVVSTVRDFEKGESSKTSPKINSLAMGITREMESQNDTVSPEIETETKPSGGILKSSLKVRAKAIDELIKKFQPTSSDVKESAVKVRKVSVHSKKQGFSPNRTKTESSNEIPEATDASRKPSVSNKNPEITFPPPPPPEPSGANAVRSSEVAKGKKSRDFSGAEIAIVKTAVSSAKSAASSSKSIHTPSGPKSSFLFNGKTDETKSTYPKVLDDDTKTTSSAMTEETKTASSSAGNHGRFKKNERSSSAKRQFEKEESSYPSSSSKTANAQKDESKEKKSSMASKETEKPKMSKYTAPKLSAALEKTGSPQPHVLKKVSKNDEVTKDVDPVPVKKETKSSKTANSAFEKISKSDETNSFRVKDNTEALPRTSEWTNVKDKAHQINKNKLQSNTNGDVSPKSDSLIGKSQSEDSGITRGDQISSDSQISEKVPKNGVTHEADDSTAKTLNENANKLNTNVSSPKIKSRHTKERKRPHKHNRHGVTCKHCKRIRHDFVKSSGLSKGSCDDYYDKVIKDGLPFPRHVRRPDSWASDMSWEEFAERDFISRLKRDDIAFDKHKHLNSSFKRRLTKQRQLHRDALHLKFHHADEVFSHPDPYKNGFSGRHHRSHRRQSSLSDDNSSIHFDPYYSRTPSVCSCEDCWTIPHFTQVNFGRSSVRSKLSDWNYNDLCTCHLIPDLLEHRRKVKFAENHSTHVPYDHDHLEKTNTDEDEEENSNSLGSEEQASSISDGNHRSHSSGEPDGSKSSSSSVKKEKETATGNGLTSDSKSEEQYRPHPWELEEWDRLMRHRLLKKRRRRAMCMGVMALAMVVFVGLVVAIVMVYLRRKML